MLLMLNRIAAHTDSLQVLDVSERDFEFSLDGEAFLHTLQGRV